MQNATIPRLIAVLMVLGTHVQPMGGSKECVLDEYCVFEHQWHDNIITCLLDNNVSWVTEKNPCPKNAPSCDRQEFKECLKNLESCGGCELDYTCGWQDCCASTGQCNCQLSTRVTDYARQNCLLYCKENKENDDRVHTQKFEYIICQKDTLCPELCAVPAVPSTVCDACDCNGDNTATTVPGESSIAPHVTDTSTLPGTTQTSSSSTKPSGATEGMTTDDTSTMPYISSSSENTMLLEAPSRDRNNGGPDVAAAVVGALVAVLLATGVAVVIICWWRRRRSSSGAEKSPEAAFSAARSKAAASTDPINHNETELTASTKRKSEHVYTQIESPTSERQAGDESMYSELDDVTGRKLPTAPALGDNYSLAHNPDQPQPMQGTTTSASVYSLAHNPEAEVANTPKYFILKEEGKGSSGDDQSAGGQYFILEEGAADAENEGKKLKASQGAVTMHGAHEYSSLASTGRADNRNDPGAEYTPLSKTSTDKQGAQSANGEGLKKDGQYFILEEGTTEDDDDKGNGGQYFILEEGAANENKDGQQGGQYFILEERAAAMDDSQDDAAERDYSHLNPADMGDKSSDRNEYTPLGFVAKDPAEKPATTTNEYFELESDYSLQKTV